MVSRKTAYLKFSLALSLSLCSHSLSFAASDDELLSAPDEHTAAALKRAGRPSKDLQKITSAPTPSPAPTTESKANPEDSATIPVPTPPILIMGGDDSDPEVGPPPKRNDGPDKPVVVEQPAPGTADLKDSDSNEKPQAASSSSDSDDKGIKISIKKSTPQSGVTAETSMKWLENGNQRYVKKHFRADGRTQTDRNKLLTAQKPHAIILACSDSRVPPELVFDQGLGEVAVVRVAGEALDSGVIASIEQLIMNNDGPHLLVVMGHTRCDAIDQALKSADADVSVSDAMEKLLADIRPRLKSITKKPSSDLEVEAAVNADGVARDLVKRSDIIRKKVDSGDLTIKTALYWLKTGKVKFY